MDPSTSPVCSCSVADGLRPSSRFSRWLSAARRHLTTRCCRRHTSIDLGRTDMEKVAI